MEYCGADVLLPWPTYLRKWAYNQGDSGRFITISRITLHIKAAPEQKQWNKHAGLYSWTEGQLEEELEHFWNHSVSVCIITFSEISDTFWAQLIIKINHHTAATTEEPENKK